MTRSYARWIIAQYRKNPPKLAQDAVPARELEREVRDLGKQWNKRFAEAAPRLARWFLQNAEDRSRKRLMKILRDGGFTVQFKMTPAMRDVAAAAVAENVSLIKSIGEQYHSQVEQLVMRSVTTGRDLSTLERELQARFGVTKRRAALIARDQNNKATAVFTRVRQEEAGIEQAIWLHSHGGKEPRPTHLENSGKSYKISEGWFDPDPKVRRFIHPGELINCFPGSTRIDFAANVEKAFRHFYSGELTEIITDSGKTLRSTPNHPILTPHGWQPISLLNEGDEVVEISDETIDAIKDEANIDRAVPLISEIFASVAQSWRIEIALGNEFHGDARPDGDIDIVFPARPLSFGRKAFDAQSLEQFGFTVSDQTALQHSSFSQLFVRALFSSHGIMSSAREVLSFLRRSFCHSNEHRLALISDAASYSFDPNLDRLSLMPKFLGQRQEASSALMQRAQSVRIIGVKRRAFSGHVFNLQTREGYYSAEGIICHNCRCVSKPIIKGFS